jgi:TRAP-type C4-dicarboxylate transport system permease small subunit
MYIGFGIGVIKSVYQWIDRYVNENVSEDKVSGVMIGVTVFAIPIISVFAPIIPIFRLVRLYRQYRKACR